MARAVNKKVSYSVCSDAGDVNKIEGIKRQKLELKMSKLMEVLDAKGVRSPEFYNLVKPFIMKTLHRYIPYSLYCEDIVNEVYMKIIIAFEGGYQERGRNHKKVYKEAYFDRAKCKNIGNFLFTLGRNEATRFLTQQNKLNLQDDIAEHLECKDYSDEPQQALKSKSDFTDVPIYKFKHFKFNSEMEEHLKSIKESSPSNNILRLLMDWGEYGE